MRIELAADTDVGTVKHTNQDSLSAKILSTEQGRMAFVVLCDGMGGLQSGEVASADVVRAFDQWVRTALPALCREPIREEDIQIQWRSLIESCAERIRGYGERRNIQLGTTVVVALFADGNVYAMNVGDSRLYEIYDGVRLLTRDHSVVWRDVERGALTPEEAKHHPQRNILLQSVGGQRRPVPSFYRYELCMGATYLFCSDGFHHEIADEELAAAFGREAQNNEQTLRSHAQGLINTAKQRGERDNISVVVVRCSA